jgi:hypothetical protein
VWKITILRQKIIFFSILGGARAPSLDPPLWYIEINLVTFEIIIYAYTTQDICVW